MSAAKHIDEFLTSNSAQYHLIAHKHTHSALDSAHSAHIPEEYVVKSVLLHNLLNDNYSIALLPACKKLDMDCLISHEQSLELANEEDIGPQFPDCTSGVVPGFGQPYYMDMICDNALQEQDKLYFEAGDHESLVEIDHNEFMRLFRGFNHCKISIS